MSFRLSGKFLGNDARYEFELTPSEASTRNSFVPRLWANRKVGYLMDEIRQSGADAHAAANDPKTKELVDEVIRLSKEYGILTEYTAFLIREQPEIARRQPTDRLLRGLGRDQSVQFYSVQAGRDAVAPSLQSQRSGAEGVHVEQAIQAQKYSKTVSSPPAAMPARPSPPAAGYAGAGVVQLEIPAPDDRMAAAPSPVQYAADRTFLLRDGKWVDSRIVDEPEKMVAKRTIEFASDEYMQLAERLAKEGRAAILRLPGDILLLLDGATVLIKGPAKEGE